MKVLVLSDERVDAASKEEIKSESYSHFSVAGQDRI